MSFKPYKPREIGTTKEVVTRLLNDAGGIKRAALLLERSPTQTLAYSDPATEEEISLDAVRRLVLASGSTAPAEDLASLAGGVFLPLDAPDETFDALTAEAAEEWGSFTAELLRAHAAGTPHEAANKLGIHRRVLRRRLDALIRELAAARAKLIEGEGRG